MAEEVIFKKTYVNCPAAYPRNHPTSTMHPDDRLIVQAAIYEPKELTQPLKGSPTLIFHAANGMPREAMIPFFEDLYNLLKDNSIQLNGIISFEAVNQTNSNIINEKFLGDTYEWNDGPRDLLSGLSYLRFGRHPLMMNGPLIGMGHSVGGNVVFALAEQNPRYFCMVLGLEAMVLPDEARIDMRDSYAAQSHKRRDIWPDLETAKNKFAKNPAFKNWDPRAFGLYLKYGFRELPTHLYPNERGVTLSTDKHAETHLFVQRSKDPNAEVPFEREEPHEVFNDLLKIAVPKMFLCAESSFIGVFEEYYPRIMKPGDEFMMIPGSHLVPYEQPKAVAEAFVPFIKKNYFQWVEDREKNIKTVRKVKIDQEFVDLINSRDSKL